MSLPHFPYVNNIPKKVNQAKTPEKWGKKRLRIFPYGFLFFSLRENSFFLKGNDFFS